MNMSYLKLLYVRKRKKKGKKKHTEVNFISDNYKICQLSSSFARNHHNKIRNTIGNQVSFIYTYIIILIDLESITNCIWYRRCSINHVINNCDALDHIIHIEIPRVSI